MTADRRYATATLALAVVVLGAGVAGAFLTDDDSDPGSGVKTTDVADAIVAAIPPGHIAVGEIDNDVRYELQALDAQGDRYVVTVYRHFDADRLVDAAGLDAHVVNGDDVWTGFDDDVLQAVFVRTDAVTVRLSHEVGGGPTPARPAIADLTTIAQHIADDPSVIAIAAADPA